MDTSAGLSEIRFRNQILAALPHAEMSRLWPHLTRVRLANGQIIHDSLERIDHVVFMEQGFTSMVAEADSPDDLVEVGLIGPEGMVGLSVLFSEARVSYNRAMVQSAGVGYRMPVSDLSASLGHLPELQRLLNRALELTMAQATQTAACNGRHQLKERLARWLLMAHDRTQGDQLLLTQEFLSIMLAVRRSGVTIALQGLEAAGLVRHARGRIQVCDRPGLEAATCPCYARLARFTASLSEIPPIPIFA